MHHVYNTLLDQKDKYRIQIARKSIFDENDKNPKTYQTKNKWIKFNGSIYPHETQPFTGDRYTLVYYDIIDK